MNKKGQEGWIIGFFVLIFIIIVVVFVVLFASITVNRLTFIVENGEIADSKLEETLVSRLSSWIGEEHGIGFYDIEISSGSKVIKEEGKTGAGVQVYYLKEFVECVNVTILNKDTGGTLDEQEICKK